MTTPERLARDHIDEQLRAAGWVIQPKSRPDIKVATGVVIEKP